MQTSVDTSWQGIEGIKDGAAEIMCGMAREKTWRAVEGIAALLKPGMTEGEGIRAANGLMASMGVKKFWHKTHIRFGRSTVLSFNDPYHDGVTLTDDDLIVIDIGPIWDGVEGDAGCAVVVGSDPNKIRIARDVRVLHELVAQRWRDTRETGTQLMTFAEKVTREMGYLLHPTYVKGHRLSEFPHKFYSQGSTLFDLAKTPQSQRWVLETHICEPGMTFGAFYEDILM